MSSTDRAPEPTMEEILASIRRIISEEENNDAADVAAAEDDYASPPPRQSQDAREGAAAEQTFDNPPEAAAVDADFTDEPLEDLTPLELEQGASLQDDEILELGDLTASAPGEPAPTGPEGEAPQQAFPQDPAAEQTPAETQPSAFATEEPGEEGEPLELSEDVNFPFKEEEQAETGEALVRETSALEAAIAALKGDQARASDQQEPEAEELQPDQSGEELGAASAGEPVPAEEISEASLETALQEAAEDEEVDFDGDEAYEDPEDDETLAEDAAAFSGAFAQERRNGTHHRESGDFAYAAPGGSLEETVKAMLRPMLREWLDRNMDRLLQEALHEELQAEGKQQRN